MTLEIISGGAGTGKSRRCLHLLQDAVSEGRSHEALFLTFNSAQVRGTQEYLREKLSNFIQPSILTFNGLIREILFRSFSPPLKIAPENMALYLFRRAVDESGLSYYGAANGGGLYKLLKAVIDEFKGNDIAPEAFANAVGRLSSRKGMDRTFGTRAGEVSTVYNRYQRMLKEYGLEEWPDAAQRAHKALQDDPRLFKEMKLLIMDGFFYLTAWQRKIVSAFINNLPRSVVAICFDEKRPEIFTGLKEMYDFLTRFPDHEVIRLKENRRAGTACLSHIERNLFRSGAPRIDADESFAIFEAEGGEIEAEMIARSIKLMVMDGDYDYNDFSILLRSDANYKEILEQVFERFQIPLVASRSIHLHKVRCVRAIISLLEMSADGWTKDRVLSFLRDTASPATDGSGLAVTSHLTDYMENRALASGVDDRQGWVSLFRSGSKKNERQAKMDADAGGAIEGLLRLESKLSGKKSPGALIHAVSQVMGELKLLEKAFAHGDQLDAGAIRARRVGLDFEVEAAAMKLTYDLLHQFLELNEAGQVKNVETADLLDFLSHGAETMEVELPSRDSSGVWLANLYEARVPEVKVVFVAGLTEGMFPPAINEDPIFNDRQRRLFNGMGSFFLQEKSALHDRERYLFYIALTRASEKVVLTYPRLGPSGRERPVSFYVEELNNLFNPPSLDNRAFSRDGSQIIPRPHEMVNGRELAQYLAQGLHREDKGGEAADTAALYNLALEVGCPGLKEMAGDEKNWTPALSLNHSHSLKLIKGKAAYSVSEINTYRLCRFKYFCRYQLGLLPREEYRIDYAMEGEILHDALRRLYHRISQGGAAFPLDDQAFIRAGMEELEGIAASGQHPILSSTRGGNFKKRMERTIRRFLAKEFEYQSMGATRTSFLELSFGSDDSAKPQDPDSTVDVLPLELGSGETVGVRGRIDRVDLLEHDGKGLGIVIDYKRGSKSLSMDKMKIGDDIRVPLYMLALKRLFGVEPAAGLHYSIRDNSKKGVFSTIVKDEVGEEWGLPKKGRGCSSEELVDLLSKVEEDARGRIESIREGEITVRPLNSSECRYCDYDSICRYAGGVGKSRLVDEEQG